MIKKGQEYTLRHLYYVFAFWQDFDGQARAENLSRIIVVLFGVVGLVWGYIIQQFSQTVYILGAGLVLATIVSTPTKSDLLWLRY